MNNIIAKKLEEQLRVLGIFLKEYENQLCGDILSKREYFALKDTLEDIHARLYDMRLDERINTEVMS